MGALKTKHELATVVHRFGRELMAKERLGGVQIKALHNILRCRTAVIAGTFCVPIEQVFCEAIEKPPCLL